MPALQLMASGAMAELADAADLKSAGGDTVWVRPPPALLVGSYEEFGMHSCTAHSLESVQYFFIRFSQKC